MKVAITRLVAMSCLALPLSAISQEHVTLESQFVESPIILADDGWYQVQDASDYSTVCEGALRSCDIPSGTYTVINHTAGTRLTVNVSDTSTGPISVTGNMVSWASNSGWYEVQSVLDYSTACESDTSCVVDDGVYVVINHLTGARYENIQVGVQAAASVTVEGNVINWPLDGWYQVQNSIDYTSVCEGGASCEVAPGTYTVINHTTGERFSPITVGDTGSTPDDTDTDTDAPLVVTADNATVAGLPYRSARVWLNNVVTGRQVYTGEELDSYFDFAIEASLVETLTSGASNECVGGGTVDYLREMSGSTVVDTLEYVNCVLPEGSIDGRIVLDSRQASKVFNVAVVKPTGNAVLAGDRTRSISATSEANPLCSDDTLSTRDESRFRLYNSTLTETTESGIESHFYSNLSTSQIDFTRTDCEGFLEHSLFGSSASYTHTLGDQITLMEIVKSGAVATNSDLLESLTGYPMATLTASVDTPDSDIVNVEIMAANAPGSSIDITIDDGVAAVEFSEALSFKELSTP